MSKSFQRRSVIAGGAVAAVAAIVIAGLAFGLSRHESRTVKAFGEHQLAGAHRAAASVAEVRDERLGEPQDATALAGNARTVARIGVLAKRGKEHCLAEWGPTADYLTREVSGYSFTIMPLSYDEVIPAVGRGEVDFILANPALYVQAEMSCDANRLATLVNREAGDIWMLYRGVILHRADRKDIQQFGDLKGKSFMAVDENSFGGWLAAWRELKEHGINPHRDFSSISFGGTHDAVVYAVLEGKVDAGTVRTGTLERMAQEGRIRLADFRVFAHSHVGKEVCEYPFMHSTDTYPEWPMAALRQTPDELAEHVASALLKMMPDGPAARAAHCVGWTVPHNYQAVRECLKALRVAPYKDYGKVTLWQAARQYWLWVAGGLGLLVGAALSALYVGRLNGRLHAAVVEQQKGIAGRNQAEDLLRAERDRARKYIDIAGVMLIAIGLDKKVALINKKGCEILGYPEEEIIGKNWFATFLPADVKEEAENIFGEIIAGRFDAFEYAETPIVNAAGEERILAWHNAVLRDRTGEITDTLSSAEDITERERARGELNASVTELERFNRMAVGRETRMIELKREVNEMARKAGIAPPYDLAFIECGGGTRHEV